MTDSNTEKPPGFPAGSPSYAGQQPGTPTSQMADQARSMVRDRLSKRASKSANEVTDLARALRQTGRQLDRNLAAPLVNHAADQLERVAELLDTNDPDEFVRNVERFARQQPLLFLGGAFALGLAGARFLKSSAAHAGAAGGLPGNDTPFDESGDLEGFQP